MKAIVKFLKQLLCGTLDYNHLKCICGSENLKYVNESADGFYIEFECEDCLEHKIV